MGITEILLLIKGLFEFPKTILAFVKLLQKTPQEKHEDIVKAIETESKRFEETGRPTW